MPQSPIHVIPGLYQPGREKWLQKDNKTPSCRKQAIDALLVTTILQSGSGVHRRTCLSAYPGIVDVLFAQIVRVREKRAKGKPLDKADQEFYRRNRELVDLAQNCSAAENDLVKQWTGG